MAEWLKHRDNRTLNNQHRKTGDRIQRKAQRMRKFQYLDTMTVKVVLYA